MKSTTVKRNMENRIKEQLMLFSDRTSTHSSQRFALVLFLIAYVFLQMLRRLRLAGTELARRGPLHSAPVT